jgi:diguanylate cyclase (GGDEF)-like protein
LIHTVLRPDTSVTEIAALAPSDPAFALRVMMCANSRTFGLAKRVETIAQATKLLGGSKLRSLAVSLMVTHLAQQADAGEALFCNCLRRAVAAQELASRTDFPNVDLCLGVGMLLDAGAFIHAQSDPIAALLAAESPAPHRLVRERVVGFTPHPELGARIAGEQGLDDDWIQAIRRHHDPRCPRSALAQIAWAAERVAGVFEGGCFEPARAAAEDALGYLGLRASELGALLAAIPDGVAELARVLDRPVATQLPISELRAHAEANLAALTVQYEALISSLESVVTAKESLECSLRDSNGRLEKLSSTDPLTGVLKREAIEAALTCDLARADRDTTHLSVVLVDIDHFATINEVWGHAMGDSLLAMVGKVLSGSLRLGDVAGRLGSDEFICILPDTDGDDAFVVAEKLRASLQQNAVAGPSGPISITASIGVATIRGPGCRTARDALLSHAAKCQAIAKCRGRDRVVYDRSA